MQMWVHIFTFTYRYKNTQMSHIFHLSIEKSEDTDDDELESKEAKKIGIYMSIYTSLKYMYIFLRLYMYLDMYIYVHLCIYICFYICIFIYT